VPSRILTTHAGSLPRPADLDRAWARHFRGEPVDRDELAALVEAATTAVVARQAGIGIDVAGDGEQGRESFFTHVRERFAGFGGEGEVRRFRDVEDFPLFAGRRRAAQADEGSVSLAKVPAAVADVEYLGQGAIEEEMALLRAASVGHRFADLFVTVPSPGIVATAMTNRHYPTLGEYVEALAAGLAHEYRAVLDAGFVLQIDAPDLAMERHVSFADRPLEEFVAFAEHVLSAIDQALGDRPRDRVRLHVCWGNYDGPHSHDVPLEEMLPVYASARVGALVLSMSNPRHAHEYRLLGSLPAHVGVVAGCIDTTSNYVEHPRVVADRIVRVVEAVGDPSRVQAGTDCGFGTTAGTRDVAGDVAWAKLSSLVEGARLANEQLSLV
jgi:5-methyltetrahydropteroyltriglutamate--homocysteine methyltransferase